MANQYFSELLEKRIIAEKLLTQGLVTVAEIANHFGLSRQTVAVWARGIDVSLARREAIARAVQRVSRRK
jgi:transposase-like protein